VDPLCPEPGRRKVRENGLELLTISNTLSKPMVAPIYAEQYTARNNGVTVNTDSCPLESDVARRSEIQRRQYLRLLRKPIPLIPMNGEDG